MPQNKSFNNIFPINSYGLKNLLNQNNNLPLTEKTCEKIIQSSNINNKYLDDFNIYEFIGRRNKNNNVNNFLLFRYNRETKTNEKSSLMLLAKKIEELIDINEKNKKEKGYDYVDFTKDELNQINKTLNSVKIDAIADYHEIIIPSTEAKKFFKIISENENTYNKENDINLNFNNLDIHEKAAAVFHTMVNMNINAESSINLLRNNPEIISTQDYKNAIDNYKNNLNKDFLFFGEPAIEKAYEHLLKPSKYEITLYDNLDNEEKKYYSDDIKEAYTFVKDVKQYDVVNYVNLIQLQNNKIIAEASKDFFWDHTNNNYEGKLTPEFFTEVYNTLKYSSGENINYETSKILTDYINNNNNFTIIAKNKGLSDFSSIQFTLKTKDNELFINDFKKVMEAVNSYPLKDKNIKELNNKVYDNFLHGRNPKYYENERQINSLKNQQKTLSMLHDAFTKDYLNTKKGQNINSKLNEIEKKLVTLPEKQVNKILEKLNSDIDNIRKVNSEDDPNKHSNKR